MSKIALAGTWKVEQKRGQSKSGRDPTRNRARQGAGEKKDKSETKVKEGKEETMAGGR